MTTPTTNDRLQIAKMLARPQPLGYVIAANPHLTKSQVEQIATDCGHPAIKKIRTTLEQLQTQVDTEKATIPTGPSQADELARRRQVETPSRNQNLETSPRDGAEHRPPARPQPIGQPMRPYDATAQLLLDARDSQSKRVASLANRIEADLIRLRDALALERQKQRELEIAKAKKSREAKEREQARENALADVRKAEQALREAREKARRFTKHGAPRGERSPVAVPPSSESRKPGGEAVSRTLRERHAYYAQFIARHQVADADVRAWAAQRGHQVGKFGLMSRAVLDAYDNAHPTTQKDTA